VVTASAGITVQKFGGSSLATLKQVHHVAGIIVRAYRASGPIVVVVSARGDTTSEQLALVREISPAPDGREVDQLLATGEAASAAVLALVLRKQGIPAMSLTAAQAGIQASGEHGAGVITQIEPSQIVKLTAAGYVAVIAGFQGVNGDGDIVTLGRGGSDTTAVALAAALGQHKCAIYTDVDGVLDADPRIVSVARPLPVVAGALMTEMSFAGAKVVHVHAAELALRNEVDLHVSSSLEPGEGTVVRSRGANAINAANEITTIASDLDVALASVWCGTPGNDLVLEVFSLLDKHSVPVDSIGRSAACRGATDISFTVHKDSVAALRAALWPLAEESGCDITIDADVARISVVGNGLLTRTAYLSRLLAALAAGGVDVAFVSASQLRISAIVPADQANRSVQILHRDLRLSSVF
jgi:aspartate kinase